MANHSSWPKLPFDKYWNHDYALFQNIRDFDRYYYLMWAGFNWQLLLNQDRDMTWDYAAYDISLQHFDPTVSVSGTNQCIGGWRTLSYCSELGDRDTAAIRYNGETLSISSSGCSFNKTNQAVTLSGFWRILCRAKRNPRYLDKVHPRLQIFGLGQFPQGTIDWINNHEKNSTAFGKKKGHLFVKGLNYSGEGPWQIEKYLTGSQVDAVDPKTINLGNMSKLSGQKISSGNNYRAFFDMIEFYNNLYNNN